MIILQKDGKSERGYLVFYTLLQCFLTPLGLPDFLVNYPTLNRLTIADVKDIAKLLQPLGLFFRAERLSQTAQIIMKKHKGKVPQKETELLKLSGIGKYTARAILS